MSMTENPKITLAAGEDLAARKIVKLSGATAIYADAGDVGFGITEYAVDSGENVSIRTILGGGTFEVTANGAITAGVPIYCAADGKVSMTPAGPRIGWTIEAATADGDLIEAILQFSKLEWLGKIFEAVAADKTLDAQDVGKIFYVTVDAKTITLPATVVGLGPITIMNGGADATVAVNVSPNALDKIMGPDIAGTDDKDQINTKATAKRGDYITITGDGADGWWISAMEGTWAEEA